VSGEDGQYITVIYDTPEEAQQLVILHVPITLLADQLWFMKWIREEEN